MFWLDGQYIKYVGLYALYNISTSFIVPVPGTITTTTSSR